MVCSKLTWEYLQNLIKLITLNNVTLLWRPRHRDITGKERADSLAKKEAGQPFIRPIRQRHIRSWDELVGLRNNKLLLAQLSRNIAKEILKQCEIKHCYYPF